MTLLAVAVLIWAVCVAVLLAFFAGAKRGRQRTGEKDD